MLPVDSSFYCITYGGGKFVSPRVGYNNGVYSTDGITWEEFTLPSSGEWYDITYGNGLFVAIECNPNHYKVAYSRDAINWNISELPHVDSYYQSISYGNGRFVVLGGDGYVAYSEDAVTWESGNPYLSDETGQNVTQEVSKILNVPATSKSTTVTLASDSWTQSGDWWTQSATVEGVTADSAVVTIGPDIDNTDAAANTEILTAWGLLCARSPDQGAGTLTFYATSQPEINIPVNVGVS